VGEGESEGAVIGSVAGNELTVPSSSSTGEGVVGGGVIRKLKVGEGVGKSTVVIDSEVVDVEDSSSVELVTEAVVCAVEVVGIEVVGGNVVGGGVVEGVGRR